MQPIWKKVDMSAISYSLEAVVCQLSLEWPNPSSQPKGSLQDVAETANPSVP